MTDKELFIESSYQKIYLRFGLIPEFIGRLPVIATLEQLDEEALIEILTKPKNAFVKQYQKLLELDDVELEFEEEALVRLPKKQLNEKQEHVDLRSIIEGIMLDVMFDLPSRDDMAKCIITDAAIKEEYSKIGPKGWNDYTRPICIR